MTLPPELLLRIEQLAAQADRAGLARAAQDVSARYRREQAGGNKSVSLQLRGNVEAVAYAAARMPATYAAVSRVLEAVEGDAPKSLLDFGAGPGTATLAALARWPDATTTMVENNAAMRGVAGQLVPHAAWAPSPAARADMVLAAYVLNEMPDAVGAARMLWEACDDRLVLVDAGTPDAHAMMMRVRDALLHAGAHLHAPCPHDAACPFMFAEDGAEGWCHFSARLPRTRLHKALKGGDLGYEDEKFTYLVFGRRPGHARLPRVVGHPRTTKVMDVTLCQPDGRLERAQISKRDARYKAAKKARWGDTLGSDTLGSDTLKAD